jgi:hypothetical protein
MIFTGAPNILRNACHLIVTKLRDCCKERIVKIAVNFTEKRTSGGIQYNVTVTVIA